MKRKSYAERIRQSKCDKGQRNAALLRSFEMEFVIEEVNDKLNQYPDGVYIPEHIVCDTYGNQDLIIALKMSLIADPQSWHVHIDSHFHNLETDDMLTIPFEQVLPAMTFAEFMNGGPHHIERGAGIKTRWKGCQDEMIKNWESKIPQGYDLVQSQAYVQCDASFKDMHCYLAYQDLIKAREAGKIYDVLKRYADSFEGAA